MVCRSCLLLILATASGAIACDARIDRERAPTVTAPTGSAVVRRADGAALEYTLRFESAHNHYIDVEMTVPTGGKPTIDLMMAVWTPGSYLVREYSQHLEGLEVTAASDGASHDKTPEERELLEVEKTRKNRWTVTTGGADLVSVRYRVYGRTATVRTNFVDDELAVVIGAATFLTVPELLEAPHDVLVIPRSGWKTTVTGLDPHPGGAQHHYVARDFDELVDSPIVSGNPTQSEFEVGGVAHTLATFGGGATWDADRSARDVEKLTREHTKFWGTIPYRRYTFINALLSGGGGLEHKTSTLMIADPWLMTDPERYRRWLGLVSHEFFHTWNVKRLRPVELGPFDYENEVYTRGLWIAEGVTSFYDDLLAARAGILTESQYIEAVGGQISAVQKTPGRAVQSLANASFDAWIEYYRPDENSANVAISYYTKGAVVSFLLDVDIRIATGSRRSLDDVMRLAYQRYSGDRGFSPAEFRAVASEVAGIDLAAFFRDFVDGTVELDYGPALDYYGLRFKPPKKDEDDDSGYGTSLGVRTSGSDRITITRVERETPAYAAGLNVDDELIAIDGARISAAGLSTTLDHFKPDATVAVMFARRGRIRSVDVKLAAPVVATYELERAPVRSTSQASHLQTLLSPSGRR